MSNVNRLLILIFWVLARILGMVDVVASSLPVACLEVNSATAPTTMTASGTLC